MARRTEYDEGQAAKRLRVPAATFRWARHAAVIPAPDASSHQWSRAAVEAMDPGTIRAALPREPISGGAAADRIADALGTPNQPREKAAVSVFVVRRLIARGLLKDLTANPDGVLLNADQVDAVCQRADLAVMVAADTPLGPNQAAERLRVRRVDFDWMHERLKWISPAEWREVQFGTSRAGAVDVPMFTTSSVDALPAAHPEVDWDQLRAVGKGRRSPLAALRVEPEAAPA